MKLIIETIANGWLVRTDDGENVSYPMAFAHDEESKENEVKVFSDVLYYINEEIGPTTSRYDKARIHVDVQPGDKYEDIKEN